MSTTLKEEFEIYINAVAAFDKQDYEFALQQFQVCSDTKELKWSDPCSSLQILVAKFASISHIHAPRLEGIQKPLSSINWRFAQIDTLQLHTFNKARRAL